MNTYLCHWYYRRHGVSDYEGIIRVFDKLTGEKVGTIAVGDSHKHVQDCIAQVEKHSNVCNELLTLISKGV